MIRYVFFFLFLIMISCKEKEIDLSTYHFEDPSLELKVVASEPNIIAPVAIDFDKKGRLWVAEMPDYMPDINGEKESIPSGRILILEDTNGDGIMDKTKVFKDRIHHLRAIRLFKGGILYADNPNLYYTNIKNDIPSNTVVIDSTYAQGGNVEHKPNGLLKSLDNCFYNAKSHYRYCFSNDEWTKESVFFRGQWGITSDENGRIYTNDNSNLIYGDALLPGMITHNKFISNMEAVNQDLVGDRSVFPLQATAINRGYNDGILDAEGKLIATTSACGPYIYQSKKLSSAYQNDAFVCVPEANLVKQLEIKTDALIPNAEFTFEDAEFLISSDESFRPVNISVGPGGEMYIVDFHRGIIQHKIYMSNYLREQILGRNLDKVVNYGRILRVQKKGIAYTTPTFDFENQDSLLHYLSSDNEWLRRMAHEELVYRKSENVDQDLYELLKIGSKNEQLHSLWILEARKTIDLKKLKEITFNDPWVIANLFKLISTSKKLWDDKSVVNIFNQYASNQNPIVQNHVVAASHLIYDLAPDLHTSLKGKNPSLLEASVLSSYPNGRVATEVGKTFTTYNENIANKKEYYIHNDRKIPVNDKNGYSLYNTYCSSCHGFGGEGSEGQAPSLLGAKLVNSDKSIVPLIIMHGLEGGVTIAGKQENYASVMPSFLESANLRSSEIAEISNYIYNAFREKRVIIDVENVNRLEVKYRDKDKMWTESELLETE